MTPPRWNICTHRKGRIWWSSCSTFYWCTRQNVAKLSFKIAVVRPFFFSCSPHHFHTLRVLVCLCVETKEKKTLFIPCCCSVSFCRWMNLCKQKRKMNTYVEKKHDYEIPYTVTHLRNIRNSSGKRVWPAETEGAVMMKAKKKTTHKQNAMRQSNTWMKICRWNLREPLLQWPQQRSTTA